MSGVRMAQVKVETATDRVTVQEAANRLGVKDDAIRKRIQRGTLDHEKDLDGRVYVFLDATQDKNHAMSQDKNHHSSKDLSQDEAEDTSQDKLVGSLQDQIQYLRNVIEVKDRELESRTEELRRKDMIIMSLTQHLPEIAPASSPEDLGTHDGLLRSPGKGENKQPTEDAQVDLKRSWWGRLFRV